MAFHVYSILLCDGSSHQARGRIVSTELHGAYSERKERILDDGEMNLNPHYILTFPSLTTIQAEYKDCHRFIRTSRLLLRASCLDRLASTAGKKRSFQKVPFDTTHLVDFILVGLIPIQSLGINELLRLFLSFLFCLVTGQLLTGHFN